MTQEEKSILLQDLCARLPYGLKVKCGNTVTKEICELIGVNAEISSVSIKDIWAKYYLENFASIKPYLRSMSSMTNEELEDYEKARSLDVKDSCNAIEKKRKEEKYIASWYNGADWLNKNMFDYRGLIPMGLALEAKEGMYEY